MKFNKIFLLIPLFSFIPLSLTSCSLLFYNIGNNNEKEENIDKETANLSLKDSRSIYSKSANEKITVGFEDYYIATDKKANTTYLAIKWWINSEQKTFPFKYIMGDNYRPNSLESEKNLLIELEWKNSDLNINDKLSTDMLEEKYLRNVYKYNDGNIKYSINMDYDMFYKYNKYSFERFTIKPTKSYYYLFFVFPEQFLNQISSFSEKYKKDYGKDVKFGNVKVHLKNFPEYVNEKIKWINVCMLLNLSDLNMNTKKMEVEF